MKPTPYLHFDGNCKQAFDDYSIRLGGKILLTAMAKGPSPAAYRRGRCAICHQV
jgi:uncharacterized glyoxalase superfamily protein PhnB